jgi:hypothetical protein
VIQIYILISSMSLFPITINDSAERQDCLDIAQEGLCDVMSEGSELFQDGKAMGDFIIPTSR